MLESYNLVIDKGTLDCIACSEEEDNTSGMLMAAVDNIWRVLDTDASFIMVSRGSPSTRLFIFEDET